MSVRIGRFGQPFARPVDLQANYGPSSTFLSLQREKVSRSDSAFTSIFGIRLHAHVLISRGHFTGLEALVQPARPLLNVRVVETVTQVGEECCQIFEVAWTIPLALAWPLEN